jgi:MAF protein
LAETKATAAVKLAKSMGFPKNQLVLASDTIVVLDGMILGKPRDGQNALEMLTLLRGKIHQVLTAISVAWVKGGELTTDLCSTDVPMRAYTTDEITAYIATGDPLDKAGAYAIQHAGFHPVERMAGCYASVMGLPLCHLVRRLAQFGFKIEEDVPAACQHHLEYDCPVYQTILGDYGST